MREGNYGLVEERYFFGNTTDRISYGIVFYEKTGPDEPTEILLSVHDICGDRDRVSEFVDTCNRLKLSPLHLSDVIGDFLVS